MQPKKAVPALGHCKPESRRVFRQRMQILRNSEVKSGFITNPLPGRKQKSSPSSRNKPPGKSKHNHLAAASRKAVGFSDSGCRSSEIQKLSRVSSQTHFREENKRAHLLLETNLQGKANTTTRFRTPTQLTLVNRTPVCVLPEKGNSTTPEAATEGCEVTLPKPPGRGRRNPLKNGKKRF